MNITRPTFQTLFERDLSLLANSICAQCDAQLRHPLLPWLLGERFAETAERIMFIGKPHRGVPGEILQSGVIDPTSVVAEELWNKNWPYWSYTREVAENIYGSRASDFICFSNMIKCTNTPGSQDGNSTDRTSYVMAECCVSKLCVIWQEIKNVEARTLVFYTFRLFRSVLHHVPIALAGSVREITPQSHTVQCRNKRLGWWERTCKTSWTDDLRILVVGHPERMGRNEFVELLTNWLRTRKTTCSAIHA